MKTKLILLPSEYVEQEKSFEITFKSAIENYLKNYNSIYRQNLEYSVENKCR